MSRDVMQQALDALEMLTTGMQREGEDRWTVPEGAHDVGLAAVNALHAALDAPEPQPVAWRHWLTLDGERFPQLTLVPRTDQDEPLYAHPPVQRETLTIMEVARDPLSLAEIAQVVDEAGLKGENYRNEESILSLVRAVEHAHGIGKEDA